MCLGLHHASSRAAVQYNQDRLPVPVWTNSQISIHHEHTRKLTFCCLYRNHTGKLYFQLIPKTSRTLLGLALLEVA